MTDLDRRDEDPGTGRTQLVPLNISRSGHQANLHYRVLR